MSKGRGSGAKLAHESKKSGKMICPKCNTEIKKVKFVRARISKSDGWAPNFKIESICKCNEKEMLK